MFKMRILHKNKETFNMINLIRKYYPKSLVIVTQDKCYIDTFSVCDLSSDFIADNVNLSYQFIINVKDQLEATIMCLKKFVWKNVDTKNEHIYTTNSIFNDMTVLLKRNNPANTCINYYRSEPINDFEKFKISIHYLKDVSKITRFYVSTSKLIVVLIINDINFIKIKFSYREVHSRYIRHSGKLPLLNIIKGFTGNKNELKDEWNQSYAVWNDFFRCNLGSNWNDPIFSYPELDGKIKNEISSNELTNELSNNLTNKLIDTSTTESADSIKRKRDDAENQDNLKKQKVTLELDIYDADIAIDLNEPFSDNTWFIDSMF